jgi:PAS domain S-box-containing protein
MSLSETVMNNPETSIEMLVRMVENNETSTAAAPPIAPAPPSEQRLRSVIELAPVSLIVVRPDGEVLAANQAAVALFGTAQLTDVRGGPLTRFVATEQQDAVGQFVSRVCHGEAASFDYELIGPDGSRRSVRTRAVPFQREGIPPAVFLGATWELSDHGPVTTGAETMSAERCDIAERALTDAMRANEELSRQREALEASVDAIRIELATAAAEEAERRGVLSEQLSMAQRAGRAAIENMQREHQAGLAARNAEVQRLEQTVHDLHSQYGRLHAEAVAQRDDVIGKVHDLEVRIEELLAQRTSDRQQLEVEARRLQALGEQRRASRLQMGVVVHELRRMSETIANLLRSQGEADVIPPRETAAFAFSSAPLPITQTSTSGLDTDDLWQF